MNKLKYINELIENYKESKNKFLSLSKEYPNNDTFLGCVESCEERLQTLNQIKNILEAWEVVKPNIKYEKAENYEGVYMEYFLFLEIEAWKPEAFKIQKALEVSDD